MIELKQESIEHFNLDDFIDVVFAQAQAYESQVIIISFNPDVVVAAKKAGFSCGWVIYTMDEDSLQLANQLLPEYLITDVLKVDAQSPELWQAPEGHCWYWMLYDVQEPQLLKSLMDKGVDLVETGDLTIIERL